jgi:hypothetical protein
MSLRIPSFDDQNVLPEDTAKSTASSSDEAGNYKKRSSDWSGSEKRSRYRLLKNKWRILHGGAHAKILILSSSGESNILRSE